MFQTLHPKQVNAACFALKKQLRAAGSGVHVTDNEAETLENLHVLNMSRMGLVPPAMLTPLRPPKDEARLWPPNAQKLKSLFADLPGEEAFSQVRGLDLASVLVFLVLF